MTSTPDHDRIWFCHTVLHRITFFKTDQIKVAGIVYVVFESGRVTRHHADQRIFRRWES